MIIIFHTYLADECGPMWALNLHSFTIILFTPSSLSSFPKPQILKQDD